MKRRTTAQKIGDTKMNRRTFFKRVAATCAGVVAAPAALAKTNPSLLELQGLIENLPHVSFEIPDDALHKLIDKRRKESMIELGNMWEGALWAVHTR